MAEAPRIFLVEGDHGRMGRLVPRLSALGAEVVAVESVKDAIGQLDDRALITQLVLFPMKPMSKLKKLLGSIRKASGRTGARFVPVGRRPSAEEWKILESVRIEACLWDPIADTQLRFVINDAGYEIREGRVRKNPRVPTEIAARIITDVGEREALVYSLSEGGAYLETPRAMAVGARLRIELPLPWVNIDIDARVLHSNVPGNLQQQNLALGMGVEFIDIDAETRAVIADYVDECLEYLTGRRSQKRTAAPRKEAKAGRIRETGASLVTKESPKPEHDLRNSGNQVIVRCRDGRLIKGYTFDFLPQKDVFHVVSPDDENEITELRSSDPTAIFFVKSFDANRDCAVQKNSTREQLRGLPGVKLEVRFLDGEVMHGTTHGYQPGREGFFLFPVDETSNNLRVYIYEESTESVTILR